MPVAWQVVQVVALTAAEAPLVTVRARGPRRLRKAMRAHCPRLPGVYGMLDACGELIYVGKARDLLATYRKHEDVITIGAYSKGSNAQVDLAIEKQPGLGELLRQPIEDKWTREKSFTELKKIVA